MSGMMNWQQLLSDARWGSRHQSTASPQKNRSNYDRDYGRILFSSAFRRLQDKTQVFPLGRNDYVRTRLTHSLEVAHIGSSLGMLAGEWLAEKGSLPAPIVPSDVATIVSTACLAHDIGNPPFGHSGEDAIETALKRHGLELPFEGNAQGFRILTRTGDPMEGNGLKLTAAVLGAFMKYPCTQSYSAAVRKGGMTAANKLECKKFGIGEQEREAASFVAGHLGLLPRSAPDEKYLCWCRHPLAYLMEAADDICYRIADIEDGYFSGILDFEPTRDLFSPFLTESQLCYVRELEKKDEKESCIHYMRALAIGRITTGGDMETVNRLTDVLVTMNTPADRGKLFKIIKMLYGLMGLPFSEEAEPMDADPAVLEYFIFSFTADFGEVIQDLIAEEAE